MNVKENDWALVVTPGPACGKLCRVLNPHDVQEQLGFRWNVRLGALQECVIPDSHLLALNLDPGADPEARALLDDQGKLAWDRWYTPPDVDL